MPLMTLHELFKNYWAIWVATPTIIKYRCEDFLLMDIDKACEIILPRFKTISKGIWGDVVDKMTITCEMKTAKINNLASLARDSRCNPQAIDNHLYRYCKEYTLQLSPRLLEWFGMNRRKDGFLYLTTNGAQMQKA